MVPANKYDEIYEVQYEKDWENLNNALEEDKLEDFRINFLGMHPYDQAVFFREQTRKHRLQVYTYLSPEEMSEIMESLDLEETIMFIPEMDPRFAAMVLSEMAVDDAVDILNELDKD